MATLFDSASLVMIPSGYKDDKLYSIKPTNGDGDFTFSRDGSGASPATRVNASGLIEKGRENLLLQSNTFTNADWVKSNSSITANSIANPLDGAVNASTLTLDSGTLIKYLQQDIVQSGVYTYSVYLKYGTHQFVQFLVGSDANKYVNFDLVNGTLLSFNATIDAKIEAVGNDWYRCSFTYSTTTGNAIYAWAVDSLSSSRASNTSSTGNFYVYAAQLESGLVATDYIETTTAPVSAGLLGDMPRLDYSGGATCPSLLLEPSRVNSITSSEYFDGGLINTTITASYNTSDTLSPEGVNNAAKLTTTGSFPRYSAYPSTSDNTDIVISSFAKAGDASVYSLFASDKNLDAAQVYFDLSAGTATLAGTSVLTPVGYDIEPMGNGWYRCWLSINTGTGASSVQIRPISHAQGQSGGWSGSNYIYAYGAQYETGSYPTSYIPTYGSASTRAADSCSGAGDANTFNDSEGVLFAEISALANDSTNRIISVSDGSGSNRLLVKYDNSSNLIEASLTAGGADQAVLTYTYTIVNNAKIAFKYKANNFALWVNGAEVDTDSSGTIPSGLDTLNFDNGSGGSAFYGNAKQILYFQTALTDTELASLTTL